MNQNVAAEAKPARHDRFGFHALPRVGLVLHDSWQAIPAIFIDLPEARVLMELSYSVIGSRSRDRPVGFHDLKVTATNLSNSGARRHVEGQRASKALSRCVVVGWPGRSSRNDITGQAK
jgi:hypothetical protein